MEPMCYRFVLLIVFHLHSLLCTKSVSELWIRFRQNPSFVKSFNFKSSDYFSSTDNENTLKKYSRGFPRGIWGTAAFPDIIRGLSDNDTGYSFWLKYDSIVFNESYRFKESFNNFRNQIYSDSCIDDNLNKWKCCEQPNHPSCFKLPTRTKVIESMLSDPQVDISSVFAYLWCTKVWANFHSFNAAQQKDFLEDIETGCPNPCFGNPCKSTQGVKNHICQVTGAFESQPNGNVNCQIHLGNMCQPILGTDYYQCICLKSYQPLLYTTEPNCFGRINPCHTIHITDLLIDSNENQNIHPSTIIHWGLTCLNGGQCVVSEDFTHATCVCPTAPDGSLLYTGLNCEYSVGVWSSWTQPSPCYPEDCGLSRYRWRRRKCLNTTMVDNVIYHSSDSLANLNGIDTLKRTMPLPCPGASEEILPCPSLEPCFKSPSSGFMMNGIFSYETLYYFTYTTTFISNGRSWVRIL